jgi:Helix-turn-helix domain
MSVEVVTKEDLQAFRLQLISDLKGLLQSQENSKKELLRSKEVRKLLKISPGTLQTFRVNGILNPSKLGGIMYYKMEEIEMYLNANRSLNV